MGDLVSGRVYTLPRARFNPFDVYIEYTSYEKAFFLFNVEYTHHVAKNLHLLLK